LILGGQPTPIRTTIEAPGQSQMDVDVLIVKLKSNDGKFFQFTEAEASCSNALRRMLESSRRYINNNNTNTTGPYILLQSIDSKVLSNIHQWCKMHCYNRTDPSPDGTGQRSDAADQHATADWDVKFLKSFSEPDLFKLMNAANFLDIESLYDACCRLTASRWEGMKVDEIRKRYRIHGDLSSEEELQLIQENKRIGLNE
jgi:hypothetical protein